MNQLFLVFWSELVKKWIDITLEGRSRECLEQVRRSDNLLNHPIRLFFFIQILFVPEHVTGFDDLDNSVWMRDLIYETSPSSINEYKSDL